MTRVDPGWPMKPETRLLGRVNPGPGSITMHQSSFISGRHITDTIVVAQEIIHSMRSMKGKKGFMAGDLEKVYDRLRWDFIKDTPLDVNLPPQLVTLIMTCIENSSLSVLWNGNPSAAFKTYKRYSPGWFIIAISFCPIPREVVSAHC